MCWVCAAGMVGVAWLAGEGWQVPEAVNLEMYQQKSVGEHNVQSWGQTPQGW